MRRRLITPITALALGAASLTAAPQSPRAQTPSRLAARAPGWLGFVAEPSKKGTDGVRVKRVLRRSPASRASLSPGDLLVASGDTPLRSSRDLRAASQGLHPGDTLPLTIERDGARREVSLTLGARPTQAQLLSTQLMGLPSPNATLTSARDGERFTLASLRGKPVVIEFWATWCAGCKLISPHLDALARDLGDRGHVLAITDEPAERVAKSNPTSHDYLVARDAQGVVLDDFFVQQLPVVLLLDADGTIRKAYTGLEHPDTIAQGLRAALGNALKPTGP